VTRQEKYQYLLENGFYWRNHDECWYESSKDELYVNEDGLIVGFRPESEGISLEEAYKKVKKL
tara:strand:- start:669 stop:857 length:189 start_codon:yes stop_codon:yes gene_type:complete